MAMSYKMTDDMVRCQLCSAANGVHPDVYHTLPECKPEPPATEPCHACGNRNRCPSCHHHEGNPHGPNCPTLTCSEVVERLAKIAGNEPVHFPDKRDLLHPQTVRSNIERKLREQAPAILHSWRERRVQELEDLIAKQSISPELSSTQPDLKPEKG